MCHLITVDERDAADPLFLLAVIIIIIRVLSPIPLLLPLRLLLLLLLGHEVVRHSPLHVL
jgi:hypothetical protein